ncbi:MAG: NAD(+) synthase [Verrucomicrobium sp.]|nr:NAD(+) synthase [Verrucomicrobium sp.]
MQLVKAAAVALNQTPLDWEGNEARIRQALRESRAQEASVACLPELCITGYGCEDAFQYLGVQQQAWEMLQRLLPETKGMVATLGLPLPYHNGLFNAQAVCVDGEIKGFVPKQHLANDGNHYESRWFKEWPEGVQSTVTLGGKAYPIGDLLFDIGGVRIGLETCEDAWVANRPGTPLAQRGADLILNSSASHFSFGKHEVRKRIVLEGSRAFNAHYLYSNLLGNEAGRMIYDGGALIASRGELMAEGPRLSFRDVLVTPAVLDIDATRTAQRASASFQPRFEAVEPGLVAIPFPWPAVENEKATPPAAPAWELSPHHKEEEFTRAEALALFDYFRKNPQLHSLATSLSGGVDSAAVLSLQGIAAKFAMDELGVAGFQKKLSHIPGIEQSRTPGDFMSRHTLCAYQGGENSSAETRAAARAVSKELGAEYHEFDIQPLVDAYEKLGEQITGRPLDWERDDHARQNIQARVRAPGIWLAANLRNALLLVTTNRSEATVGYSTQDGDTAGGLAPLAGVDKEFLRESWLPWLQKEGPIGFGPITALEKVFAKPPSGELRPLVENQTDEKDLMPHRVLNMIERALVRDKQVPAEIFQRLRPELPELTPHELGNDIRKVVDLYFGTQWKRDREAPSFHLDDHNLDPKTGNRMPLLSGGFKKELETMWGVVEACAQREQEKRQARSLLAEATRPPVAPLPSPEKKAPQREK